MPEFDLKWIESSTKGTVKSKVYSSAFGVGTDTRKILTGSLFIALRGQNFDAHDYLEQAINSGVKILVVDRPEALTEKMLSQVSVVVVGDTLLALQDLAKQWRQESTAKFLAVTGSNGKTTTKEFAAQIIGTKFKTFASPGNFNNHWGVPLSILNIEKTDEIAIIEMGMSALGEIASLCEIAKPNVVLVTMVGSAHIGELGSQKEIATAKAEIYESCSDCIKIFNLDNEHTIEMYMHNKAKTEKGNLLTFSSFDKGVDVSLRGEKMTLKSILFSGHINKSEGQVTASVFGRHNINNIMAASCLALSCGMRADEIWQLLPSCHSIWGRNQLLELKNGAQILFDAYNASYDSTSAIVKSLFEFDLEGHKLAIIGQMMELGSESYSLHEKLGELIAQTGFETVWFIGEDKDAFEAGMASGGFNKKLMLSDTYKEKLAIEVGSMLNPLDVAIIKGSRGMKMEQILDTWKAENLI